MGNFRVSIRRAKARDGVSSMRRARARLRRRLAIWLKAAVAVGQVLPG